MKKFTLIEADKYISVDGVGIFFTEENWPFADIEHLWAIQWKDDGTEDGSGEVGDVDCRESRIKVFRLGISRIYLLHGVHERFKRPVSIPELA